MDNYLDGLPENVKAILSEDVKQKIVDNKILQENYRELSQLFALFRQDVLDLHEFGQKNATDQAWRRSLYRAVFSWIEGVVYQIKQVALCTQGGFYQAVFSSADLVFLKEETYTLKDNGKVKIRQNNFTEIGKNLRFAYAKVAEGFNISTELEVSHKGWEQLIKAIEVRNRLTHPKSLDDLTVTDEQLHILIDTMKWFDDQFSKLLGDIHETIEPMVRKIEDEGKANVQQIINKTELVIQKAIQLEEVISILTELKSKDGNSKEVQIRIGDAQKVLIGWKKDIASELGNP